MLGKCIGCAGLRCLVDPDGLRCEYLVNPLGIDDVQPRLSWRLEAVQSDARGQRQTAYQILVASRRSLLDENQGDRWDTGRVESDQSIHVPYQGRPLASRSECWWKVRIWDEQNNVSAWSEPARWSMGLLTDADWSGAKWIGCDEAGDEGVEDRRRQGGPVALVSRRETRLMMRRSRPATSGGRSTIPADRQVVRAMAFFAGDDQCVFYVNGTQVGVGRGHPNLVGVDIAGNLHVGDNQLAVAATNVQADVPNNPGGWIGAVRVEFESGPPLVIHSDRQWRSSTESEPRLGEDRL